MGGKREVNSTLRKILDWDVTTTNNILAKIIKNVGPMRNYNTTLRGLEVMYIYYIFIYTN